MRLREARDASKPERLADQGPELPRVRGLLLIYFIALTFFFVHNSFLTVGSIVVYGHPAVKKGKEDLRHPPRQGSGIPRILKAPAVCIWAVGPWQPKEILDGFPGACRSHSGGYLTSHVHTTLTLLEDRMAWPGSLHKLGRPLHKLDSCHRVQ